MPTTSLVDWREVARLMLTSRALDRLEETELTPGGKVTYQFSARGHELAQVLIGLALDHAHDAASVYYRSRPFLLANGLTPDEALAGSMAKAGSPTGGRDIGVVHMLDRRGRALVLPASVMSDRNTRPPSVGRKRSSIDNVCSKKTIGPDRSSSH